MILKILMCPLSLGSGNSQIHKYLNSLLLRKSNLHNLVTFVLMKASIKTDFNEELSLGWGVGFPFNKTVSINISFLLLVASLNHLICPSVRPSVSYVFTPSN